VSKKILIILSVVVLLVGGLFVACEEEEEPTNGGNGGNGGPPPVTKDSILIGASRPITGANAPIGDAAFGPIMMVWEEKVNADGGIYVDEYGKILPVEYLIYDDATDVGTMVRNTEKLILEDEVDVLFSSCGTAFISAQAPVANKYGMVLVTAEGGATIMKDALPGLPYVFINLPFSDHYQLPVFADMCKAVGAETAYMITIADLHGVEYGGVAAQEFGRVGIEILANKSVPITYTDFSLLVKDAQAADPDVFCIFAYPPIVFPVLNECIAIDFNPPAIIGGPGTNFSYLAPNVGGDEFTEGISCFAAANRKTGPDFERHFNELEAMVGPFNLDWWGTPFYEPITQMWEQAIEETGTLDQDTIRDYFATNHFDTLLGDTYYEMFGDGGGLLVKETHPGEIGQWQNGICEIVGGGDWPAVVLTSEWIYPKPPWPTQ
jgi:branched-chain amino acid transport system substrate-binding protein